MNIEKAINKLNFILEKAPILLLEISEENMAVKQLPSKWSKKEILGHLIDSATNNHQRFIRGQFENNPEISYDQNKWNKFSFLPRNGKSANHKFLDSLQQTTT